MNTNIIDWRVEERNQKHCSCCENSKAVFSDLFQSIDRIERDINEDKMKDWFKAFRQGLVSAQERHRLTALPYCQNKGTKYEEQR